MHALMPADLRAQELNDGRREVEFTYEGLSEYARWHLNHRRKLYREFVLKYMLTYGLAPAPGFYHSPLWHEYTMRLTFRYALRYHPLPPGPPSEYAYMHRAFSVRPGVVEIVLGENDEC